MAVPEQGLMRPAPSLARRQCGGVGVPQRVNREPLLNPHSRRAACSVRLHAAGNPSVCTGDPHDEWACRPGLGNQATGMGGSRPEATHGFQRPTPASERSDLAPILPIANMHGVAVNRRMSDTFQGQTFTDAQAQACRSPGRTIGSRNLRTVLIQPVHFLASWNIRQAMNSSGR